MPPNDQEPQLQWILDPEAASRYARAHPRRVSPGCEHRMACRCDPSDWVRCEYVTSDLLGTVRCAGSIGHMTDHMLPRRR